MKKLTKGLLGAALLSVAASASAVTDADIDKIGRASCRERV